MSLKTSPTIINLILLIVMAMFIMFCSGPKNNSPRKDIIRTPNIIFISVDTLRADRLACFGYKNINTPHIDAIAQRGVLFSQALSQVPITLPSHCSMFTGLNPTSHNVRENGTYRLAESDKVLAEILKNQGYQTAAFIGGFPLDARFGLKKGFDYYDDDFTKRKRSAPKKIWQGHNVSFFERDAASVIKSAVKWIAGHRKSEFFLFIHLFDPHSPYAPPAPFNKLYEKRLYDGEVAYTDYCLGKLFKKLKQWNLFDETFILFTSDHGESLGEHDYFGHGKKLYEPSLRIPLIISFPSRIPRGKVIHRLARSIDIMPTMLEFLNIPPPNNIQGISLGPLIFDNSKDLNLTSYGETFLPRLRFDEAELRCLRTEKWKYIRSIKDGATVGEELYDRVNDPGETRDISKRKKAITRKLSLKLDEQILIGDKKAVGKNTFFPMDEDTIKILKSLGYIR